MKSWQEQVEDLEFEMAAYAARQEELEATLWGKWVVFHGGELRGAYADFQEAANAAVTQFGRGPYHIRQVGASQDVHIPTPLWSSIPPQTASCGPSNPNHLSNYIGGQSMTAIIAGKNLLQALLDAAPVKPDLLSTDEDGNTGVEWTVKDRVIQLEVAPDATTAQWLTWRESEPLQDLPLRELDLQDAETWPPLLELLWR